MKEKLVLIWYEDNQGKLARQIAHAKKYFDVQLVNAPQNFRRKLDENNGRIAGIIVDILLRGNYDYTSLRIEAAEDDGFEAGWLIVDKFLRDRESGEEINKIPVCILSGRSLSKELGVRLEHIRGRSAAPLVYIEKFYGDWEDALREWMHGLVREGG